MHTTEEGRELQLGLGDIALLARVQRPVPSTWRTRSADSDLPFPPPVDRVGGEERFSLSSVVDWLEATGHGCNPDARDDAAAYASPPGLSLREPTTHAGLTALLCLKAVTGHDLAGPAGDELRRLASRTDPDDELLQAEIKAVAAGDLTSLAAYADAVSEAAYGPAQALERLLAQRSRTPAYAAVGSLAPLAHALVSAIAGSCARGLGDAPVSWLDASSGGSDLVLSVALADGARDVLLLDPRSPGRRLLLRRLRAQGLYVRAAQDVSSVGPAVVLAHYPLDVPGVAARMRALDAVDELALTLTDGQQALILAPASLLTDRLADRGMEHLRAQVLRSGRVRAVVRLPAGLVPHRSREALALWVLSPEPAGRRVEEQRIAVAELSAAPLTAVRIDQLRDDVLAATAPPALTRARSYALLRLVATSTVLARRGALLSSAGTRDRHVVDGRDAALVIDRLRSRGHAADALGGAAVEVTQGAGLAPLTLGDAVEQRLVRLIPGNRAGFVTGADGGLSVVGVPELTGAEPAGSRRLDRLAFLGSHAAARLSEPGDVVFCTSPRPYAVIDAAGGSAVEFPARILRIDPRHGQGLLPDVVAHFINSGAGPRAPWRSWLLPRTEASQARPLSRVLAALSTEQAALRERLAELDHLRTALVHAVTSGALMITDPKDD